MKKLILLLLVLTGSISYAADRYMSVTGLDSGTCNPTPCATFNYIQTQTAPGDVIRPHAGTYTQTIPTDWTVSGNAGAHITITPFGDGPVIISGWNLSIQQAINKFNNGLGPAPYTTVPGINCGTSCITYKLVNQLSNPNFFTDFYYLGVHRPRPQVNLANQLTPAGSPQICTTAATQNIADTNCNCPAEVLAAGGHCAAQAQPCNVGAMTFGPWFCFNKFLFQSGTLSCSYNGINIGDVEARTSVWWTMEDYPLGSLNCGGSFSCGTGKTCGVMYTSKSTPTPGSNAITGFQAGHDVMVDNVFEQASGGTWALNRVPTNGLASVPETLQDFYVFADQQNTPENPNTDVNQFFSGMDSTISTTGNCTGWPTACSNGQLFRFHTVSYVDFISTDPGSPFQFEGDNYTVPKVRGLPDVTGQPEVPASVSLLNSDHITFNGIQWLHIQGQGMDIEGTSNNITITGSAMYDVNGVGLKIGQKGVCGMTDLQVPNNITIFNTVIAFTGQRYPGGEPSGIYIGNANSIFIDHDEVYGQYNGAIEIGDMLNIGACGSGNNSYNMSNIWVTNNDLYGRCTGGLRCFATLDDFGLIHTSSNHAPACGDLNVPPTLTPNTYCIHILNNKLHDGVSNYNLDPVHFGVAAVYLDQGSVDTEVRNNTIYRISQTVFFDHIVSTPAFHSCTPVDCQFMPEYNLFENNLVVMVGAQEGDNLRISFSGEPLNPHTFTFDKNVIVWDSSTGTNDTLGKTNIQGIPGQWACFAIDGVTPVSCATRFLYANNLYYDISNQTITSVTCKSGITGTANYCPNSVTTTGYNFFTGLPWGPFLEEEVGSLYSIDTYHVYDPHIINPIAPTDNVYPSISPVYLRQIGFVPFDNSGAGRVTSTVPFITVPNQPSFMIKRFVNQNSDYGNFVASPVTTYNLLQPNNKYSSISQRH